MHSPERAPFPWLRSLRGRVVFAFALSTSLVALFLVVSVFLIGRSYMEAQRERAVERLTGAHADVLRGLLDNPGATGDSALTALDPPAGTILMLRWDSEWFSSVPGFEPAPGTIPQRRHDETIPVEYLSIQGQPFLRAGTHLDHDGELLYEFAPLTELHTTLGILRNLLIACALASTVIGAALGVWAGRHALKPLRQLAATAARIASGEHDLRLDSTRDRDLFTTVNAFNSMVDSLQRRIERERRLVSDIGHELRTPLTTLTTSVAVLSRHSDEMPERPRRALDLVDAELDHLRRVLDDLLALARAEAGIHRFEPEPLSTGELLAHTLAARKYPPQLLTVTEDPSISGRKLELERAVANLLENADRHGGGVVGVTVGREGPYAVIMIDDAGPGVPAPDRERIFERFSTVRAGRRSTAGTGIGLALVTETAHAHGGRAEYRERPGGGARFVILLPSTPG